MDRDIRVVHVGLGPMGLRVVKHLIAERQGIRYVGAIDVEPALEGKGLGEIAGLDPCGVHVTGDAARVADAPIASEYFRVAAGQVKGTEQTAVGVVAGEEKIRLSFAAFLGAEPSFDEVALFGTPEVRARVTPCWHGDHGTVAMAVNLIPAVINACPGLLTINDIVPVSFKSGNMARFVCQRS